MSIIKTEIEGKISPGLNEFSFDFENQMTLPISFIVSINYNDVRKISWSGNINKDDVERVGNKGLSFRGFRIYVKGGGDYVDYTQIYSILNHELKHVYDLYYENYKDSFDRVDSYKYLLNKYSRISEIVNFLEISNLALKHELEARNSMIYDKLRWLKTYDRDQLKNEFKKSYVYKSLLMIKEFDYSDILLMDLEISLNFTDEYIKLFMKSDKLVTNREELIDFYKSIGDKFIKKSNEYLNKCELVLDEIVKDKRPYMESRFFILEDNFWEPDRYNDLSHLEFFISEFFIEI